MEDQIEIFGGKPIHGEVTVGGAKNAALPIMIASLLTADECVLHNVPQLQDVELLYRLLQQFGNRYPRNSESSNSNLKIAIPHLQSSEASYSLVKSLRASFWVLAPLLARGGSARVAMPGGDVIGARPVDIHLEALTQMGAEIRVRSGVVVASAPQGLHPAEIHFRFPSVGATHQVLMAAANTPGQTILQNAAREPEVTALAHVLTQMGAHIQGAGSSTIIIDGKKELSGFETTIIGDRIEAASYLLAAVATGGAITVHGIEAQYFGDFLSILRDLGAELSVHTSVHTGEDGEGNRDSISLSIVGRPKALSVTTGPFPEFASDIQAPLMAVLATADGESTVTEKIYEGRFGHVAELSRMGAKISLSGQTATIHGVPALLGATVEARDIRAGAALVVAGLAARGRTVIEECQHLRRGYEHLEEKIRALGAHVVSTSDDEDELSLVGC